MSSITLSPIEENLVRVALPDETKTYKPISHRMLIEEVHELIEFTGYAISSKNYTTADSGNILTAHYSLNHPEMDLSKGNAKQFIMCQNSYNKRVALKFAFGTIFDDDVSVLSNNIDFVRKHTGNVEAEFKKLLSDASGYLNFEHQDMLSQKKMMESVEFGFKYASSIVGNLFIDQDVLNTPQTSEVKKRLSNYFRKDKSARTNLWELYKNIEYSLRSTHASKQIENYMETYKFIQMKFGLI